MSESFNINNILHIQNGIASIISCFVQSSVEKYLTSNIEKKYERYYANCVNGKV